MTGIRTDNGTASGLAPRHTLWRFHDPRGTYSHFRGRHVKANHLDRAQYICSDGLAVCRVSEKLKQGEEKGRRVL
jgi:hypothetical protein